MNLHYCDKCGKQLAGIREDECEIHIYFFGEKGERTDERTEYCRKCYPKVKKEIDRIINNKEKLINDILSGRGQ